MLYCNVWSLQKAANFEHEHRLYVQKKRVLITFQKTKAGFQQNCKVLLVISLFLSRSENLQIKKIKNRLRTKGHQGISLFPTGPGLPAGSNNKPTNKTRPTSILQLSNDSLLYIVIIALKYDHIDELSGRSRMEYVDSKLYITFGIPSRMRTWVY